MNGKPNFGTEYLFVLTGQREIWSYETGSFKQVGDEDKYVGACGNAQAGYQRMVTSKNTTTVPKPSSLMTTRSKGRVFNPVGEKIERRSTSPSQWAPDEEKVGPRGQI